jgi:hypothetical protein
MLQEANDIIRIWPDIKNIFAVAHSETEYDRQVSFLDSLLEEVGADEGHPPQRCHLLPRDLSGLHEKGIPSVTSRYVIALE